MLRVAAALWLKLARKNRTVFLVDALCLLLATYLGYALRLTLWIELGFRQDLLYAALAFTACVLAALYAGKNYRVLWPQASVEEFAHLTKYYALGYGLFLGVDHFWKGIVVPRTSLAIMFFAGLFLLGGVRASWRLAEISKSPPPKARKRALIIGAGEAGTLLARDLLRRMDELLPVGFIDDDPAKQGMTVATLPVLGGRDRLTEILEKDNAIHAAIIALPSADGSRIREYLERLAPLGIEVRVLPSLSELADGRIEVSRLRAVSLEDLLRREPIRLDVDEIDAVVRGKAILVTGAGGSIGTEICRQLLPHGPEKLILLGHGEHSLYSLKQELPPTDVPLHCVVADVADRVAMEQTFGRFAPNVVFHSAAHKHVPLMEDNPREALRVNTLGTHLTARCAGERGISHFVLISTDKAVRPTSSMGASKRLSEVLLADAQRRYPQTRYMAVRFGNVLGSRGSVVPLFERQIARGGPVTITHPDMDRFFMLIPEAVSLVLQAASMGRGGELFVLDMGDPVRILDLARTLIRLHGYEPESDIRIEFSGVRPGEKIHEELFYDPDNVRRTQHDKIFLARLDAFVDGDAMCEKIRSLMANCDLPPETIRASLFEMVKTANG